MYFMLSLLLLFTLSIGIGSAFQYKNIPEPPSLPELDVEILPAYLKNLITPKPPQTVHLPIKGKTTGFNLSNGKGYVWNDITAPRVLYHVGEKEPGFKETYEDEDNTTNNNIPNTTELNVDSEESNDIEIVFKPGKNINPKQDNKNTSNEEKDEGNTEISTELPKTINKVKAVDTGNIMKDLEDIYKTIQRDNLETTTEKSELLTTQVNDDVIVTTDNPTTTTTDANKNEKEININELKKIFSNIISEISNTNDTKNPILGDNVSALISNEGNVADDNKVKNETTALNDVGDKNVIKESKEITTEVPVVERNFIHTAVDKNGSNCHIPSRQGVTDKEFLDNLIQNEEFWTWIGDLTASFLDMLMDRITNIIKDEVASQIKYYLNHNNITTNPNNTQLRNVIKSSNDHNINDTTNDNSTDNLKEPVKVGHAPNKNNTAESNEHNDTTINNTSNVGNNITDITKVQDNNETNPDNGNSTKNLKHDMNNTNINNSTKEDNVPNKDNIVNNETNTDINKLDVKLSSSNINNTIDSNDVSLDKNSKNKTFNSTNEIPVKINAETIYGNSVGNENVTNIYIFRVSNVSDIDGLKPISALTGFITLGPHQNIIVTDDRKSNETKFSNEVDEKVTEKPSTEVADATTTEATTTTGPSS